MVESSRILRLFFVWWLIIPTFPLNSCAKLYTLTDFLVNIHHDSWVFQKSGCHWRMETTTISITNLQNLLAARSRVRWFPIWKLIMVIWFVFLGAIIIKNVEVTVSSNNYVKFNGSINIISFLKSEPCPRSGKPRLSPCLVMGLTDYL